MSYFVAKKMRDLVKEYPNCCSLSPEKAFDVGYIQEAHKFVGAAKPKKHELGGVFVPIDRFKVWVQVVLPERFNISVGGDELDLLNFAIVTTGLEGEDISIYDFLSEVQKSYGTDSFEYRAAKGLLFRLSGWVLKYLRH